MCDPSDDVSGSGSQSNILFDLALKMSGWADKVTLGRA